MGVLERIKDIEEEIARTQKNKKTEYHIGKLKAQLAKLRSELLQMSSKSGGKGGEGFDVVKYGNARVSMIGFPSVGKSSLLSKLTTTQSEVASYEFTTLTCIPGTIHYNEAKIQLLDLPGIVDGAADGLGRGRQVISTARGCDLLLMVVEADKCEEQKVKLTKELEKMGIRLNKRPPQLYIKKTGGGGIKIMSTIKLNHLNDKNVRDILHEYKLFNAEINVREDCTEDDLIDVIEGNRKYLKCLYVYNKIDTISMEDIDDLSRSIHMSLNLDYLLDQIWEKLALVRVYTKRRGQPPDFGDPIILTQERGGTTVRRCCEMIHKDLVNEFKFAIVCGRSCKFSPQRVGLNHELMDEDVIQILKVIKK